MPCDLLRYYEGSNIHELANFNSGGSVILHFAVKGVEPNNLKNCEYSDTVIALWSPTLLRTSKLQIVEALWSRSLH